MRIVADSSCDLYTLDYPDFRTVPLTVYTDERSFTDDPSLDIHVMLDYLEQYHDRSYTSCPPIDVWLNAFSGADEIFVITVTSALSGSYNSAMNAAEMYRELHPDVKISILDSLSTGAEEALLLNRLAEMIASGNDFETADAKIRELQKHTRLFWSFFSLHNLAQNGRVNKAVAAALNLLNIVIVGTASEAGEVKPTGRVRGDRKATQALFSEIEKAGYTGGKAVITHVENEPAALRLKGMILKKYPGADITVLPARGLCSYYMERRGVVISCETK